MKQTRKNTVTSQIDDSTEDLAQAHGKDGKLQILGDLVTVNDRQLILKLRSLGAGVEEGQETRMAILEAAYFADRGVLPASSDELIGIAAEKDPLAKHKYFVIKYLRDRGYIVRPSLDSTEYLRLHRKGYRPGEDKTFYLIKVVEKGIDCKMEPLFSSLEIAAKLRKELCLAIVDLESDKPIFVKFGRMNFD